MIGDIIGHLKVNEKVESTKYFWGPLEEIAGQWLPVLERAKNGDCLAFKEGRGLVDVRVEDVDIFKASMKSETVEGICLLVEALIGKKLG